MKKNRKKIFWSIGVLAVIIIFFNFVFIDKKEYISHYNPIDLKISLFSDREITDSAKETDLNFKNITFAKFEGKRGIFSSQIAAVYRTLRWFTKPDTKIREYGSWLWTPTLQITSEYIDSILNDAEAKEINVIYLSLDSYLDIFTMEKGPEREKTKEAFTKVLEKFLSQAALRGIAVDVEAGWRNWAEVGNEYKAFAIVNYVKNYNQDHEIGFRGFQYDIEPYLLEKYKEEPAEVLRNFVSLVDKTENFLSDSNLRFSVVIPDFYDAKDKYTPKFSYKNKKSYVFGHLLDILDRKENNSIIIMSYRNFADGSDGSIEVSKNEMRTAKSGLYNTKIIVAQETGDFPPPYITFYGTSINHFSNQISKINNAFADHPNFGGLAIHYINSFLELD